MIGDFIIDEFIFVDDLVLWLKDFKSCVGVYVVFGNYDEEYLGVRDKVIEVFICVEIFILLN